MGKPMQPIYFDTMIESTRDLAGYLTENAEGELLPTHKVPSFPLKMGYALDTIFFLVQGIRLREKDQTKIENSANLSALYSKEWSVRMSAAALRTLADNKFNKTEFMSVTNDQLLVKSYCATKLISLSKELEEGPSLEIWRQLAEVVVARLSIFNKRRGNEVSSVLLSRYINRKNYSSIAHDDVLKSQSPLEKKLMDRYGLSCIRYF